MQINDVVLEKELFRPELLAVVVRRLQVADLPIGDKERLLKEWAIKSRRVLPAWALTSLKLPPSELV